jgi:hypothetical protein
VADDEPIPLREVLFEFHRQGRNLRIVAIDPDTGTEVTMVGAPGYGEETLKRLAAQKLAYVLAKKRGRPTGGSSSSGSSFSQEA